MCLDFNNIVQKYNLSKMETIMLAFDLARYSKYNYNSLFSKFLFDNNINYSYYEVKGNDKHSHYRYLIYIEDEKYNIKGIYNIDLTWSIRSQIDDTDYKYNYKFFAKPKSYFETFDKKLQLYDDYVGDFVFVSEDFSDLVLLDDFKHNIDDNMNGTVAKSISNTLNKINNVSSVVDGKSLNLTLDNVYNLPIEKRIDLYNIVNNYDILLEKNIPGETFIELLCNVSSVKYEEGFISNFNLKYILDSFYVSDWHFSEGSIYDRYKNSISDERTRYRTNVIGVEDYNVLGKTIKYYSKNTQLKRRIRTITLKNLQRGKSFLLNFEKKIKNC